MMAVYLRLLRQKAMRNTLLAVALFQCWETICGDVLQGNGLSRDRLRGIFSTAVSTGEGASYPDRSVLVSANVLNLVINKSRNSRPYRIEYRLDFFSMQ